MELNLNFFKVRHGLAPKSIAALHKMMMIWKRGCVKGDKQLFIIVTLCHCINDVTNSEPDVQCIHGPCMLGVCGVAAYNDEGRKNAD